MNDTIFAVASGAGRSAISLVRISGSACSAIMEVLAGGKLIPRLASYRELHHPVHKALLDKAVVTFFKAPSSFTGEDQLELSLHGGAAVVNGVLEALSLLGLRPANPGEFTRRAFQSGKIDLLEAEGVSDLVDAETASQRDQALKQLNGDFSDRTKSWRAAIIEAAALLEASIDFPDEGIPDQAPQQARTVLDQLHLELGKAISDQRGTLVRFGLRIALVGAPNAGKSSLFNTILEQERAIVTDVPGTTRDIIEALIEIEGFKVIFADMAGLRETFDRIEQEGVRRARSWAENADLRLLVVDRGLQNSDWRFGADLIQPGDIVILNKQDINMGRGGDEAREWATDMGLKILNCRADIGSAVELRTAISSYVIQAFKGSEQPLVTRLRHRAVLIDAKENLARALRPNLAVESMAEDVRLAGRALEHLTGKVNVEAVLDEVFATFCIGK